MEENKILGASRVIQNKIGNASVQISRELEQDAGMYLTFLAMNVEVFSNKFGISNEKTLEFIKKNIETEPMNFDKKMGNSNCE